MTVSRWFLLRMRNVSSKSCRENQNTHFMFSNFFSKNRTVDDIMSKNMVEPWRKQATWRLRVAYWIGNLAHARIRAPAPTHTRARAHAQSDARIYTRLHPRVRARTHTHAHAHTEICNLYCSSTPVMIREGASMSRCSTLPVLLNMVILIATCWMKRRGTRLTADWNGDRHCAVWRHTKLSGKGGASFRVNSRLCTSSWVRDRKTTVSGLMPCDVLQVSRLVFFTALLPCVPHGSPLSSSFISSC